MTKNEESKCVENRLALCVDRMSQSACVPIIYSAIFHFCSIIWCCCSFTAFEHIEDTHTCANVRTRDSHMIIKCFHFVCVDPFIRFVLHKQTASSMRRRSGMHFHCCFVSYSVRFVECLCIEFISSNFFPIEKSIFCLDVSRWQNSTKRSCKYLRTIVPTLFDRTQPRTYTHIAQFLPIRTEQRNIATGLCAVGTRMSVIVCR